jgi:hypothetical protein
VLPCRVIQQSHFTLGALGDRLTLNTFREGPALPIPFVVASLPLSSLFSSKSFSCNIYAFPCKYCKQRTYGHAKPFRCNTYKKQGGAAWSYTHTGTLPRLISFICHSYENTQVWGYSSHSGTRRIRPPLRIPNFMQAPSFHSFPNSFPTLSQTHPDTGKEPLSPPVAESSSHVSP